jgi:hypothetical protein
MGDEAVYGRRLPEAAIAGGFIHHGHAICLLRASNAAAFVALGPIMPTLIAVPVLGEWPSSVAWVAILMSRPASIWPVVGPSC